MFKCEYELNEKINAILINPYLSENDFYINTNLIKKYNIKNVSTTLNYIRYLKKDLENNDVKINILISYPLGDSPNFLLNKLVDFAKEEGANAIEYLPKFFYLSKNEEDKFARDIEILLKGELPLTLIFNKERLKKETFIKALDISLELGINIFQFGDGFSSTLNPIEIQEINKKIGSKNLIKIVGKVKSLQKTIELLDAGADSIGTSFFHDVFKDIKLI